MIPATVGNNQNIFNHALNHVGDVKDRGDMGYASSQLSLRRPSIPTPEPTRESVILSKPLNTISPVKPATIQLPDTTKITTPTLPFSKTIGNVSTPADSPLPFVPLLPPQIQSLRTTLKRRRSSFPPASSETVSAPGFPWDYSSSSSSSAKKAPPATTALGWEGPSPSNLFGKQLTPGEATGFSWSNLLNFDPTPLHTPKDIPVPRLPDTVSVPLPSSTSRPSRSAVNEMQKSDPSRNPQDIAQFGSDLAWKTILGSVVDVEGIGEVPVTRVLQEVWRRGGGDVVTSQNLWLNIVMSLLLPPQATKVRIAPPSNEAATALQKVYNLTLRPWESAIFTGLLSSYMSTNSTSALSVPQNQSQLPTTLGNSHYGASTPTKELDMSMWTNFSPGVGDLDALIGGNTGFTPRASISQPSGLGQFEWHVEMDRKKSLTAESANGLEALLAEMEENHDARERSAVMEQVNKANSTTNLPNFDASLPMEQKRADSVVFQIPTPDTQSASPSRKGSGNPSSAPASCQMSPANAESPFVTASSGDVSTVSQMVTPSQTTQIIQVESSRPPTRQIPPTSLTMPTAPFVPPPPMCMFFSPKFRDLQSGKVGVWKGDLEIKGRNGGNFSILIVGEEEKGHLWQSHLWPSKITYPSDPSTDVFKGISSCTSTMIPVAHLARENFLPIAIGMVLCNSSNIEEYVSMVQGLHAEGVAFHLPNPARLPIVFLPAKFDSSDTLQRLGIAYMSKTGAPPPKPLGAAGTATGTGKEDRRKKRQRRQSAPAKTGVGALRKSGAMAKDGPIEEE